MKGFELIKKNDYNEKITNIGGVFQLLFGDEELEIIESDYYDGRVMFFTPEETNNTLHFFYIQSGQIFHVNSKSYLNPGDKFIVKDLTNVHMFYMAEHVKTLCVRNSQQFKSDMVVMDVLYRYLENIQSKDHYTGVHCNYVGNISALIATLLKLDGATIENIVIAGKVHDVGKIKVPIEILNKHGRFTSEEYELIKKHTLDGLDIIIKETGYEEVAKIVVQHHERLDGSGYPNGLKAEDICIGAKILAVVDSFEAMISERPYKKSLSKELALEDLKAHKNDWYDPLIVDLLEELIQLLK